jgi:hypothetical protein
LTAARTIATIRCPQRLNDGVSGAAAYSAGRTEIQVKQEPGTSEISMSDAGATVHHPDWQTSAQNRIAELKVSGQLMTLDTGLFCLFQAPAPAADDRSGLPGVRISLPPGPAGRPEAVQISTFRNDGWMHGSNSAALIRVTDGPAQVLVTVYQSPSAPPQAAPRLQVMRLSTEPSVAPPALQRAAAVTSDDAEVLAHVQRTGDVPGRIGEWVGTRGSGLFIEGFSLMLRNGLNPGDIEYQAVLGRGWRSPWYEGGKFCGSRGMALPLLGLNVQLKGTAAKTHECSYSATFIDGSAIGPVLAGVPCETENLAALEAFQLVIHHRGAAGVRTGRTKPAAAGKLARDRVTRSRSR